MYWTERWAIGAFIFGLVGLPVPERGGSSAYTIRTQLTSTRPWTTNG